MAHDIIASSAGAASTERLLPGRQVWSRYGITDRTLARWLENEELQFPRPLVVNGRRYWRLGDLECWERARPAGNAKAA